MSKLDDYLAEIEAVSKVGGYDLEAYHFVLNALNKTVHALGKPRHISGAELLEGIRKFALDQFGVMTLSVFSHWGIYETLDFGKIVFELIDAGLLKKQPEDTLEDFLDVYSFAEAFSPCFEEAC